METRQLKGPKAPPRGKPGKWEKPGRVIHVTKKGPGRKAKGGGA